MEADPNNKYPVGFEGFMPIDLISPSQPDDGSLSSSTGEPVSVYTYRGKFVVENGNHRYYDALRDRRKTLYVEVVGDSSY